MLANNKRYWIIEITKGSHVVFRKRLTGNLTNPEIEGILQRLASRDLSAEEVIAASLRKPKRNRLLEVRIDGAPYGARTMIWLPEMPDYKASYWREDELANYPEILNEAMRL